MALFPDTVAVNGGDGIVVVGIDRFELPDRRLLLPCPLAAVAASIWEIMFGSLN